jgi:RNA polymerase sigma-70 factor, ECF subfamily
VDYSAIPPEDLSRACLESGNAAAWAEFVRRFHPLISKVVLRVSRQWGESSSQVVDDLIQETYLKFCEGGLRGLQNFKSMHRDAIFGYIKVFTANLVHDHFKASHSLKRGGNTVLELMESKDARATWEPRSALVSLERRVLIQQIDACLKKVLTGPGSERDRRIFWLYYRAGLAASAIAAIPEIGLGVKGVESAIHRLTAQIKRELAVPERSLETMNARVKGIRAAESL